ncbi:MAG: prolipoprotein diacylglyceryl transferase [Deltaproteobacteria bacterium]|jgi:phosphatidylglycerol:prolipoprotein diacylglycerol transferase|nr:prolipoprotein diacylglyceryl transferase [Deltaproteobacteria bacterium]
MISYPTIDPIAFSLGPLHLRWYGFMYLLGFLSAWLLARGRIRRGRRPLPGVRPWTTAEFDDLATWVFLGVIAGARVGYVLFYDLFMFFEDPLELFRIWHGGMSFHGGFLGVLLAFWYFARRSGRSFLEISDFIAPLIPPGLFFGRIGNFINAEHWGTPSNLPWAMIFPGAGPLPRHPSQLYEAALEGFVLFVILWAASSRTRRKGLVSGLFALLYGIFRCVMELVREPDAHIGYLAFGWLTLGQLLTVPLVLVGVWLIARAYNSEE